ncbi:HD domain protein [compost metagenome]
MLSCIKLKIILEAGIMKGKLIILDNRKGECLNIWRCFIMLIDKINTILSCTLEKNEELHNHLERTSLLSFALAKALNLNPREKEQAYFAGLLHDIGRIHVSGNDDENQVIYGSTLLKFIDGLEDLSDIVKYHLESWNSDTGSLKQEDIPLLSRVVLIASDYDDMRNVENLTHEEAVVKLMEGAGTKYDPHMVEPFIRVIEKEELV